jgi:hypothetical protein
VHLVARGFGGSGGFHGARAALFWSGLALSPAVLAIGLVDAVGVALTGRALAVVGWLGVAALGLWVWIFAASLAETEGFASTARVAAVIVLVLAGAALFIELAARGGVR